MKSLRTVSCRSCQEAMQIDRQAEAGVCGRCFLLASDAVKRKHGVLSTSKRWKYTDSKSPLSPVIAALNPAYRENARSRIEGRMEKDAVKDLQNAA